MPTPHPIVMLEIDGMERAFFADLKHRIVISIDDPREWYSEDYCNGTIDEMIMLYRVTEH